ncbi:RNA-directed DNA polymerase, eukaryota [Tanacetum coccineum]
MVNIYAPQDDRKKEELWQILLTFWNENPGSYIIFGDFNVVRNSSERVGSQFNHFSASSFNNFINDGCFWDVPLGGHAYTRLSSSGNKLSKLDRFLISEHALPFFQNHHAMVLDSFVSDHRPIILKHVVVDFGPVPFKFYNSWLTESSLDALIETVWHERDAKCNDKNALIASIKEMESLLENGNGEAPIYHQRSDALQQLRHIEHKDNMDAMQKAKIKWAVESDKNSKFFHGIINKKRRQLAIQGIKRDGIWITDPDLIKTTFFKIFKEKFQRFEVVPVTRRSNHNKTLQSDHLSFLDAMVTEEEIRMAIWERGSDKSPGPDGFTFAFFKRFWNVMKGDIIHFVQEFFRTSIFPNGCNSSFITLIPKTHSPTLVTDYRPISLIGAQYKIIAKVLSNRLARNPGASISERHTEMPLSYPKRYWELLPKTILGAFTQERLGCLLRKMECNSVLDEGRVDIVVSKWFMWERDSLGVKIIVAFCLESNPRSRELVDVYGIYVSLLEVCVMRSNSEWDAPILNGYPSEVSVPSGSCVRQVGDVEEECRSSLYVRLTMMEVKLNLQKSKLYGVGVSYDEVQRLALLTECNSQRLPFVYLGHPIAKNMAKHKGWEPIIDKFNTRMSRWKVSMLSIGGRTTLLSLVLGALASKAKGGLGIGSLEALNHALIQKWRWRFLNTPSALWVMTIKAIHGLNGDFSFFNFSVKGNGVWARIVKDINAMNDQGFIPHHLLKRNVHDGRTTRFWKDVWMGDTPLQHQFPRLFRLEVNQDCMVRDKWNDGWNWIWSRLISGGTTSIQLSNLSTLLNSIILTEARDEWMMLLFWTPPYQLDGVDLFRRKSTSSYSVLSVNISIKGVELESIICPNCSSSLETVQHSLWACIHATCVWHKVFTWLDLPYTSPASLQDVYAYIDQLHFQKDRKLMLESIFGVVLWTLWSFQNNLIFSNLHSARNEIFDKITSTSFLWYTNRNRKANISWTRWMQNPLIPSVL